MADRRQPGMTGGGWRELALVVLLFALLTAVVTYPLVVEMGHVGRVDNADGQWSIWIVSWVARTLVVDPLHVFDANIFYPHRGTLAYSETNLGAGALAIPAYWLSGGNPYAAHNSVVLLSFVLTATGTYYLVRYLTHDRRAAIVSAICLAFCPYLFVHTAHIQLLLIAGLPFSLLAFHRLADQPTVGRGAALGAIVAAQAIACGYYGVFVVLMVVFADFVIAVTRRRWLDRAHWTALGTAGVVALALIVPLFLPYAAIERDSGFGRTLENSRLFSARWSAYVASPSRAHEWLVPHLPPWGPDALFPGIVATVFGIAGIVLGRRRWGGELPALYGGMAAVALWISLGPAAGAYSFLYKVLPVFRLMRAPARFGVIVSFGLSVLAGLAVAALVERRRRGTALAVAIAAFATAELVVSLDLREAPPVAPVYQKLAALPRGPVIELPFYYPTVGLYQHAKYMLASTAHWRPLVNGYSDYIPPDFLANVHTLAPFPTEPALNVLKPLQVRYAVFHMYGYNDSNRADVITRLTALAKYFRPIYVDDATRLYEIVEYPP